MNINNLVFFDKNGESYNLSQSTDGFWEGADYFLPISIALYDCSNLFILENTNGVYSFPKMDAGSKFEVIWKTAEAKDNFFLFTVTREGLQADSNVFLNREESLTINHSDFSQSSNQLDLAYPLQLNIGFSPIQEKSYARTLQIYYTTLTESTLVLEMNFYGEGEDEDERFRVWLSNFGVKFNREDALLLKDYDLKEGLPDWAQINQARKQLLVNIDQVYPYVGTYKGLLNLIDLMGYRDILRVKEYWRDADPNSTYFKKFAMVDVTDLMQIGDASKINLVDANGQIKKGGKFRKTEFLALAYQFTIAGDTYDDDGLPEVVSTTDFTVDEIFFKLHGLARKLKNEIIPINVIIKDIIGEFIYFEKFNLRNWLDLTQIEALQINDTYKIKLIYPEVTSTELKIRDLKTLYPKLNGITAFPALTFNYGQVNPYQDAQAYPLNQTQYLIDAVGDYYAAIKDYEFKHIGEASPLNIGDDVLDSIGCPVVLEASIPDLTLQELDSITFRDFITISPTTSSSNNSISAGTKYFTCVTVQPFTVGMELKIYVTTDNSQWMEGTVAEINPVGYPINTLKLSITNYSGYLTSNTAWTLHIIDSHFTISNIKYRNSYELEWTITGPQNYQFQRRGKITELAKIPHMLPHTGEYLIQIKAFDMQGGTSVDYQRITVQKDTPVLQAFMKMQDKFRYDFKNLHNVTLGDLSNSPLFDPFTNIINPNGPNGAITNIISHHLDWYTYSNYYSIGGHQDQVKILNPIANGFEEFANSNHPNKLHWGTGTKNGQATIQDYDTAKIKDLYHLDFSDFGYIGDTLNGYTLTSLTDLTNDPYLNTLSLQYNGFQEIDLVAELGSSFSLVDLVTFLSTSTYPGWDNFRYQVIGSNIKATSKFFQKTNSAIIRLVKLVTGLDSAGGAYQINNSNTSSSSSVINLGGTYEITQPVGGPALNINSILSVGDQVQLFNDSSNYVEGLVIAVDANSFQMIASTAVGSDLTSFTVRQVIPVYTFNNPRNIFDDDAFVSIQQTLSQVSRQVDEDLLFLACPFDDIVKDIDQGKPAPASNIQYWINKGYVEFDDTTGEQTGFLPSYYDENSFNLVNIKATSDTLTVPVFHPVIVNISNLVSNTETVWTLYDQSDNMIITVKSPSYFIWRFPEPGQYRLTASSTDTRNNVSETTYTTSICNVLASDDYFRNIEKQLNERKHRMTHR